MGRSVAGVLVVLLLIPGVLALEGSDTDARGDVRRTIEEAVDDPRVDLVNITATEVGQEIHLSLQVAGVIPVAGTQEPQTNQTVSYLFVLGFDPEDDGRLFRKEAHELVVVCRMQPGVAGISCESIPPEFVVRSISAQGAFLNITVNVPDDVPVSALVVGGASNVQLQEGNQSTLLAQDFSPQADPFGGSPGGDEHDHASHDHGDEEAAAKDKPWWQSGWLLLLAAAVGIGIAYAYNRRRQT